MKSGIRDFGVAMGGQSGRLITGILTQSILAWQLGPADRGSLAVCLLYSSILFIVFAVSCDISAVYFVSSKKFSFSEGVLYTILYGVLASGVGIVVGWFAINLPLAFFEQAEKADFRLVLLFVPVSILGDVLPRILTAIYRFKLYSFITVLRSVAQCICTIIFVLILDGGVRGAIWATILAGGVVVTVTLVIFRWKLGFRMVSLSAGKFFEMFKFGLRYYPGKLSNKMNLEVAPIMLAFFVTRAELGWFAIASRMMQLVEMIPETMTTVLFPRVAGDREGRSRLVARAARVIGIVCGLILVLLALFAGPLVSVIFSPSFLPAVPFIRILVLGLIIRCFCKVLVPYIIGVGHPGQASAAVMAGVATNLAFLWILLPRFGVIGAPWAMTASYLVSSVILLAGFISYSGLSLRETICFRRSDWQELEQIIRKKWKK